MEEEEEEEEEEEVEVEGREVVYGAGWEVVGMDEAGGVERSGGLEEEEVGWEERMEEVEEEV